MEQKVTTNVNHVVERIESKRKLFSKLAIGDWFRDDTGVLFIKVANYTIWNVVAGEMDRSPKDDYHVTIQAEVEIKTFT